MHEWRRATFMWGRAGSLREVGSAVLARWALKRTVGYLLARGIFSRQLHFFLLHNISPCYVIRSHDGDLCDTIATLRNTMAQYLALRFAHDQRLWLRAVLTFLPAELPSSLRSTSDETTVLGSPFHRHDGIWMVIRLKQGHEVVISGDTQHPTTHWSDNRPYPGQKTIQCFVSDLSSPPPFDKEEQALPSRS